METVQGINCSFYLDNSNDEFSWHLLKISFHCYCHECTQSIKNYTLHVRWWFLVYFTSLILSYFNLQDYWFFIDKIKGKILKAMYIFLSFLVHLLSPSCQTLMHLVFFQAKVDEESLKNHDDCFLWLVDIAYYKLAITFNFYFGI